MLRINNNYCPVMAVFVLDSYIRGYHVCKNLWTASMGEELPCVRDTGNG